jgi:hypothetical protein
VTDWGSLSSSEGSRQQLRLRVRVDALPAHEQYGLDDLAHDLDDGSQEELPDGGSCSETIHLGLGVHHPKGLRRGRQMSKGYSREEAGFRLVKKRPRKAVD